MNRLVSAAVVAIVALSSQSVLAGEACNWKLWRDSKAKCALAGYANNSKCETNYYMAYASRSSAITCTIQEMTKSIEDAKRMR